MDTTKLIKAAREVIANADDTGCDSDLTVTSGPAVGRLNMALRGFSDVKLIAKPLSAGQIRKSAVDGRLTVAVLLGLDELGVDKDCLNDAVSRMPMKVKDLLGPWIFVGPVGVASAELSVVGDDDQLKHMVVKRKRKHALRTEPGTH